MMVDLTRLLLSYSPTEEIVEAHASDRFHIETEADVSATMTKVVRFWRANCHGRLVYLIIDYTNYTLNVGVNDFFRRQLQERLLNRCVKTIVRFGGSPDVRAAARRRAMDMHVPSHVYESREEARDIVRALREGRIQVQSG